MASGRGLVEEVLPKFQGLEVSDRPMHLWRCVDDLGSEAGIALQKNTAVAALTNVILAAGLATRAMEKPISYRDYQVAATGIMVNFQSGAGYFVGGQNVKLEKEPGPRGDEPKIVLDYHGEQVSLAKGRKAKLSRLVAMAIVADPSDPDANPEDFPTLRVCRRCIGMCAVAPEVDERTLFFGVTPDFSACEVYTLNTRDDSSQPYVMLTSESFGLQTEADFDYYDRNIMPSLIAAVNRMYDPPSQAA